MNEVWRLVRHWDGEPGLQMARDEALLEHGGAVPVLRLYTWEPDALSLGYFQKYAEVAEVERASVVVRRWTGGGAIHHASELTFAVAAPLDHPLYRGPVAESYRRVHAVVIDALARVGVTARLRGDTAPVASDLEGSGMCFRKSTAEDVVWDDAKGVGSAQRRRGGRVLHHGSIKLDTTELEGPIARTRCGLHAMTEALLAAFTETAHVRLDPSELTEAEAAHATARASFFTSDEFLHRR